MTEVRIQGPRVLDSNSGKILLDSVLNCRVDDGATLVIDFSATHSMNSPGGAWLIKIADHVRGRDAQLRFEGQEGPVAEFMELIGPSFAAAPVAARRHEPLLERVGGSAFESAAEFRDFYRLVVDAIYWSFIAPFDGRGLRWSLLVDELHEMGVRAVRINFLMNFLLGLIIAMLSAAQLETFGATILVADLMVIAFFRELAAIMTAVVVSARTGAAIAAELATMQVQEEIDALRGMGLNVSQFLVAPKLLALLVVMPCLVAQGIVAGLLGGSVWGVGVMGIDWEPWFREMHNAARIDDFVQGMLKSVIFAFVIVLIGCHNGLRVAGGSRGVGLMTTRAVVMDIFALITIDMVFALMVYYVL